jgi:hypothetical protein
VHVVEHADAEIGQGERLTGGQPAPHVRVQVAGRGDHRPPRAGDVPRVQDHRRHPTGERLAMQQFLDRDFADAVLAVPGARFVLGDRHPGRAPVHPDGAAVQQQRTGRSQCLDELPGRLGREADQVDDRVRAQAGDPGAERAGRVLGLPVRDDPLDRTPLGRAVIRLATAPAHRDDLIPGPDQARNQIGTDVPGRTDDHHSTHGLQPTTPAADALTGQRSNASRVMMGSGRSGGHGNSGAATRSWA